MCQWELYSEGRIKVTWDDLRVAYWLNLSSPNLADTALFGFREKCYAKKILWKRLQVWTQLSGIESDIFDFYIWRNKSVVSGELQVVRLPYDSML